MARVIPIGVVSPLSAPDPAARRIAAAAAAFLRVHAGAEARVSDAPSLAVASVFVEGFGIFVSAGLFPAVRRPRGIDLAGWQAMRASATKEIVVEVRASLEWLLDPLEARDGLFWREFASVEFKGAEDAFAWIRAHCRKAPVPRVPPREMRDWRSRIVQISGGSMPFVEAVTALGARYREAISADELAAAHGMTHGDAEAVADAARRVLPRRPDALVDDGRRNR